MLITVGLDGHTECKAKLVLLSVVQSVTVAFLVKGHTHSPLDAVGGQCVVKCSNHEFCDAAELVSIYHRFLTEAKTDEGTGNSKMAYKCDESANWEAWWDEVPEVQQSYGPTCPAHV